jgi:hypothetical protein
VVATEESTKVSTPQQGASCPRTIGTGVKAMIGTDWRWRAIRGAVAPV